MFTKIVRLDLRFLSLVHVKNCPFQFSKFSFSYGKVEILCSNLAIYISSRTINLSLPVLVEKRIIHLVEDNAFNLIDMFTRNEFFDKIFVYFFFFFFLAISCFDDKRLYNNIIYGLVNREYLSDLTQ